MLLRNAIIPCNLYKIQDAIQRILAVRNSDNCDIDCSNTEPDDTELIISEKAARIERGEVLIL